MNQTVSVAVRSALASSGISATAHYKTKDTTNTAATNKQGSGVVKFRISHATPGYRVVVDVSVGASETCQTSFTPR